MKQKFIDIVINLKFNHNYFYIKIIEKLKTQFIDIFWLPYLKNKKIYKINDKNNI